MGKIYRLITNAIQSGKLREPFTSRDFRERCIGLGKGTYNTFLWKHRLGNPGDSTELFKRVSAGKFRLLISLRNNKNPRKILNVSR